MDARVKTFEEKMQKTVDFLGEDFMTIRAGKPILMYLIRSRLITTEHRHHCSRLVISQFRNRE